MKRIFIKEDKLHLLVNEDEKEKEEVTFYEFFINTKTFLKDLLKKPQEANVSDLFKKNGITKSDLIQKMKDIGLIKSNERIDEVPVSESKKHPYGTKLVSKHYVKYNIPKKRFDEKIKELYKMLFSEQHVFKNTEKLITDILDMDSDYAYRKRGGYSDNSIDESDCGGVMQGGGTNPDAGQYTTPIAPTQRRSFYRDSLKRNGNEKNKSISINNK